jgi:hypothetical protein
MKTGDNMVYGEGEEMKEYENTGHNIANKNENGNRIINKQQI